jgi:hypothetical protein
MDPPYLGALKGEYGVTAMGWFKNYQQKWINTGKFRPIMHVMGIVLVLGYAMEYPHLKRTPALAEAGRVPRRAPPRVLPTPAAPHPPRPRSRPPCHPLLCRRAARAQEKGRPRGPPLSDHGAAGERRLGAGSDRSAQGRRPASAVAVYCLRSVAVDRAIGRGGEGEAEPSPSRCRRRITFASHTRGWLQP